MKLKNKIIIIFVAIFIIIIGIFIKTNFFFYRIEDRTEDIKKFKGVNGEKAIAWLRVQGTNIDFPIVYYEDSNVNDSTYNLGWNYNNSQKIDKKTTLFSHNILNVSSQPIIGNKNHKRFEQLMSYIYIDFVKENKYIQYSINGENYLFKIYAISFKTENELDYENVNPSDVVMKKYVNNTIKKSYFNFNVDVDERDKLISLVTCTRFFGDTTDYSFVVDGRLIRKNELIKNYQVEEKNKYNKIKEIMKGDVEDA